MAARNSFMAGSKLVILLVTIGNVAAHRLTESFLADTSDGCDGDFSFELITGYKLSSPSDMLDSLTTILLTDCIERCKSQPQCQAFNYETGLCALFSSQAGDNLDFLNVSQWPVFTMHGQKVCLSSSRPPCTSPWAYETSSGLAITKGFTADKKPASSRQECAFMCIMEEKFICRAAAWDASTNTCKLSQVDRNMAGRKQLIEKNDAIDYIELACVVKPERLCEFQRLPGRMIKTVDAAYQVQSTEECKEMCLNADFSCYSYDFRKTGGGVCRLSHHTSATLAHLDEPYLDIDGTTTFELVVLPGPTIPTEKNTTLKLIPTTSTTSTNTPTSTSTSTSTQSSTSTSTPTSTSTSTPTSTSTSTPTTTSTGTPTDTAEPIDYFTWKKYLRAKKL